MKTTGTASIRAGLVSLALCAFALLTPASAHAQATLITGLGTPPGITGVDYGPNVMTPNDDGSSAVIDLTAYNLSGLCFFGATHNSLYINNNGNVTFNAPVGTYTPSAFPIAAQPMIAPWWADVDTRGTGPAIPG
ncbi:MAG: nidogen-like domain-containing protein, partial [Deltaproteobacteria bacterium]